MSTNRRGNPTLPALLVLGAALTVSACESDPVTELTADRPVLKVLVAAGSPQFPSGSLATADIEVVDFDTGVDDAFGRASAEALDNYRSLNSLLFGSGFAFDVGAFGRTAAQDPRLPALEPSEITVDLMGLYNAAWCCGVPGRWNFLSQLRGLEPGEQYTVALARLALNVNGALDQADRLLGRGIGQPDQLVLAGGTPGGVPNAVCNFSALARVQPTTNPVVMGYQTANAEGVAYFDCVPTVEADPASGWWRNASTQTPSPEAVADSLPFGANRMGQLPPGRHNYILVYRGRGTTENPVPTGEPVLRVQVGPDIDMNGNVINNGFRPFPASPMTPIQLLDAPGGLAAGAFGAPGTINLNLTGLPVLTGRNYQLWAVNASSGSAVPSPGTITIDGEVGGAPSATFNSPGAGASIQASLSAGDLQDTFGDFSHIVVSIESGQATTPSETRFLWREYLTGDRAITPGTMSFGSFTPGNIRPYVVSGGGQGEFFGDSLLVRLNRLNRPAQGFQYASYLVNFNALGEVTGQARLNAVTLDEIGNTTDRIGQAQAPGGFGAFSTYVLALEPVGVEALTRMRIHESEDYADKFSQYFRP